MKRKKYILLAITLVIVGLLITSTTSTIAITAKKEQNKLTIKQSSLTPQKISMTSQVANPSQLNYRFGRADPIFNAEGDQLHPAFGYSGSSIFASFYDSTYDTMIWTGSVDDGASWLPDGGGIYYDIGGDYPSIKVWDSSPRFFGTFVTDFYDLNGGPTYIYEVNDVTNLEDNYLNPLNYWDWSTYGWSDMLDADIACDNSQNTFEWGVSSYVMSTTYGSTYTDGPTIVFSDEATAGSGWISWYYYNGCDHTDVDIDHSTVYSYAVYDWEDTTAGYYKLLCRVNDFDQIQNGFDQMYEMDYGSNLQNPAVAAGNGNIVILAENNASGNKDIICFYGSSVPSMSNVFVVNGVDDEMFPDVRYVESDTFVCTYVKNGNLYAMVSDDAGATWTDLGQVNSNDGAVVEEYKTSDLCEQATKAMWEEPATDIDIWWGDTGAAPNQPPTVPTITGPTKLKPNKEYTYTFSSTDPEGNTPISYYVDWGDGNNTGWITTASASHIWTTQAGFTIKVKAKDSKGAESAYGTLDVSTPRINPAMFRFLERFPILFRIIQTIFG